MLPLLRRVSRHAWPHCRVYARPATAAAAPAAAAASRPAHSSTAPHTAKDRPVFYAALGGAAAVLAAIAYHVAMRVDEKTHDNHIHNTHDTDNVQHTPPTPTPATDSKVYAENVATAPTEFKYVIVGGGTAAYNAAVSIQDIEPNAEILMISESSHPPYRRSVLSKPWLEKLDLNIAIETAKSEEKEKLGVFYRNREDYDIWDTLRAPTGHGMKLMLNSRAVSLDANMKSVMLASGQSVSYGKLLIATGYKPETPADITSLTGPARRRVLAYNYLEDREDLHEFIENARKRDNGHGRARVALLGSELLATELAVALAKIPDVETTQLTAPQGRVLLSLLPSPLSAWLTDRVAACGVKIRPGESTAPPQITQATTDVGAEPPLLRVGGLDGDFDVVIVEGRPIPEVNLAAGGRVLEIDAASGAIAVSQELMARSDIYVAGAAASYYDSAIGARRYCPAYEAASTQGFVAGRNMASPGQASAYTYQPSFRFDGAGLTYEAVGIVGTSGGTEARAICAQNDETQNGEKNGKIEGCPRCTILYSDAKTKRVVGVAGVNLPQDSDGVEHFLKMSRRMVRSNVEIDQALDLAKMHKLFDSPVSSEPEAPASA